MSKKDNSKTQKLFSIIAIGLSLAVIGTTLYVVALAQSLPPIERLGSLKISQTTKIYDRTGDTLLYEIFGKEKRTVVPFEEIPEYVKEAAIAAEDEGFYTQPAFDWKGIARAMWVNIKQGRIEQGGSTITQQLVKNAFLTPERTIARKIKELIIAIDLESRYSKDEILAAYLNQIPYGSNAYGIEAASQKYFGKSVEDLSLAESAVLASLPRAPSYYSPWGNNKDELLDRKNYTLDKMSRLGYITEEQAEQAKQEELEFAPQNLGQIRAPHFTLAVKDYLVKKYGEEMVRTGGLEVTTTLDWEMQQIAQEVVKEGAKRNERLYNGKNAAMAVQDPDTGQILSMVGSRDWYNEEIDGQFNVITQGMRQPGSALKPFAYLTAFEKGFRPNSLIFDVPTEFVSGSPDCPAIIDSESENDENCFNPENFDQRFRGAVTMQEALSQSINVPSVKTLYLAGFDDTLETLHEAGITTLRERWRYGLSLVLGGGEVKPIDLLNAYSTLADEGTHHKQSMVLEVKNNNGEVLESYQDESNKVLEQRPVRQINQILSSVELRSGLFQSSLGLTTFEGREVALKTGTTNNYKDAWAMGYTPYLAVGVWAGNSNNDPMSQSGSSLLAAIPMWSNFLDQIFKVKDYPTEVFNRPKPQSPATKPMLNGQKIFSPTINGETYPQIHSILHWVNKENPTGPVPDNPLQDPQYYNWEESVTNWAEENFPGFNEIYNKPLPENVDFTQDQSREESQQQESSAVTIESTDPENGDFIDRPFNFEANISSENSLESLRLYFNGDLIQSRNISGNTINYGQRITNKLESQNRIRLEVTDSEGNEVSRSIIVYEED